MLKKIVLMLILAVSVSFAQEAPTYYDAVTRMDSTYTAVGDSASYFINSQGRQIFTIFVPSTFDGTKIIVKTTPDTVKWSAEGIASLEITCSAGDRVKLTPSEYYWLDQYVTITSDAAAAGTSDKWLYTDQKYFKK